ncbi:MAG: M20/M25/M40 family metallo-hydrolase [Anaerolineae bacterium]
MADLTSAAAAARDNLVQFAQRLVQTPSLSGHEGDVAALVAAEMRALGYDEVRTDAAGDVVGMLRGSGGGRSVMLNGHMDHVDPGPLAAWAHPPYAGVIADGRLHGRAAADMKGSLAAMVYAVALLRRAELRPAGDVVVAAVVQEEIGGIGTQMLLETSVRTDCAIVGEATSLRLMRGHRGRLEILVTVDGRSVHASAPERGANPHYSIARFVDRLRALPLPTDPDFCGASVAPTLVTVDQTSTNVTPGRMVLHLDYRSLPGEGADGVVARLQALLDECLTDDCSGHVEVERTAMRMYTGLERTLPNVFPAFRLDADDDLVRRARAALAAQTGSAPEVGVWRFSTDGGHLMQAGVPTIGYGPGEEHLVHTVTESIGIEEMVRGAVGYASLCLALSQPATSS